MKRTLTTCIAAVSVTANEFHPTDSIPHYTVACPQDLAREVTILRDNISALLMEKGGVHMGTDLKEINRQIEADIAPACLGAKQDEQGRVWAYAQAAGINTDELYEKFLAVEATKGSIQLRSCSDNTFKILGFSRKFYFSDEPRGICTATEKKEQVISLALDVMEQAKLDEATDEQVLERITEDSVNRIRAAKEAFVQEMSNAQQALDSALEAAGISIEALSTHWDQRKVCESHAIYEAGIARLRCQAEAIENEVPFSHCNQQFELVVKERSAELKC